MLWLGQFKALFDPLNAFEQSVVARVLSHHYVVAAHGVGGTVGALLTGVFASKAWNPGGGDGLLYGNGHQVVVQSIAILATLVYSSLGTFVIVKALGLVARLRTDPREEGMGMDFTQHGEEAYSRGEGALLLLERRSDK